MYDSCQIFDELDELARARANGHGTPNRSSQSSEIAIDFNVKLQAVGDLARI